MSITGEVHPPTALRRAFGEHGADLHLHSIYSDGVYTPNWLVSKAVHAGLDCIALTDHDTVEGCEETATLCEKAGLGFIPGVELTAYALDEEIHILGFGLDIRNAVFLEKMSAFQEKRLERMKKMVSLLNREGIPISLEEVLEIAKCKVPGRMHLCRALLLGEYCRDRDEVFARYLGDGCAAYVPKMNFSVREAIRLIHTAGGAALMAHVGRQVKVPAIVEYGVEVGIDGFECFYPRHSKSLCERLVAVCEEYHLLVSGGTDYHGVKDRVNIGAVKVPMKYVEELKQWDCSKNSKKG